MKTTDQFITGWDIGGAHLKVSRVDGNGNVVAVLQLACALWRGLDQLEMTITHVKQQLNNQADLHAVTMTGELVDLFNNRQHGVEEIIACLASHYSATQLHIFAAERGWLTAAEAKTYWQSVASMNWYASASLAASKLQHALFIDIGSTTCDIIPIVDYHVVTNGNTDLARQTSCELLYTGAIRTPLIALCQTAPFNGQQVNLAAELFATTADCWVLLNKLDANSIQDSSADGQDWSKLRCMQRLARLLGTDADAATDPQWLQLASWFAQQQLQLITNACLQVISAQHSLPTCFVGAGVGRFMVEETARRLGFDYIDLHHLVESDNANIADHAPAVAVALLAYEQLT